MYDPARGTRFATEIRVQSPDGTVTSDKNGIHVRGARKATVLLANETSFNGFDKNPATQGKDYRAIAERNMSSALSIYYYQKGFLHAKTMMIDGRMASVGSANLDFRSFKLNFEINAFIYNQNTVDDLERIFVNDIRECRVITP